MASQALAVLLGGEHTADLVRGTGRFGARLQYLNSSVRRLSLSLPVTRRPHAAAQVTSWLQGLLPDDARVLQRWAEEFNLPDSTPFSLLSSPVGYDCAGAVQFCAHDDIDRVNNRPDDRVLLSLDEVETVIEALHQDALAWLGDPASLQFSLSGGETKTALQRVDGQWFKPSGSAPSTHILKPELVTSRFEDLPLNEHLCQTAARNLGMPAARTEITSFAGIQTVVIERYDRLAAEAGLVRLHQEDACQALGLPPSKKYERQGGPSTAVIAELIRKHSSDAHADIERYRDALIFNWLIAGSDAHAKNYSLFLDGENVRLTPLYDLASGLPYRDDYSDVRKIRLAQKIGRGYTLERADRRSAWEQLAAALKLPADQTIGHAEQLAAEVYGAFEAAVEELPDEFGERRTVDVLLRHLNQRARICRSVGTIIGPISGQ